MTAEVNERHIPLTRNINKIFVSNICRVGKTSEHHVMSRSRTIKMELVKLIEELNSDVFTHPGLRKCETVKIMTKHDGKQYNISTL